MNRQNVPGEAVQKATDFVINKLQYRLEQKGIGAFASSHEILGVLTEEFKELISAVQSNNLNDIKEELGDILVGAYWGIACIENDLLDWPKEEHV